MASTATQDTAPKNEAEEGGKPDTKDLNTPNTKEAHHSGSATIETVPTTDPKIQTDGGANAGTEGGSEAKAAAETIKAAEGEENLGWWDRLHRSVSKKRVWLGFGV